MRIIFFTMSMNKGGAERVISNLCNNELGQNNEIHVVTCLEGESQYFLEKKICKHRGFILYDEYVKKGKIRTLPKLCKKYVQLMKKIDPDIIISFLPEPCFIAGLCKRSVNKPLIGSERGNPYYRYRFPIYKLMALWLYQKADGFVFQTEGAKKFFGSRLQKKSWIIGNPIWIHEKYRKLPIECNKEIVSVGRFTPEKNYPLLLRAFKRVAYEIDEYVLKIYGKIDESLKLKELVEKLELSDRVFFMGQVDDVLDQIQKASVFVLSSMSEGMPNALMEAMAIGLPVVATDCQSGGPRQLITHGVNGLLVKNNDEIELASAILRLIEDESLRNKLSVNASKIVDEYSEEKICHQWQEVIDKVIQENM